MLNTGVVYGCNSYSQSPKRSQGPQNSILKLYNQGCALVAPGGPWHIAFAPGQPGKLKKHKLGTLDFTGSKQRAPFNVLSTALKMYACLMFSLRPDIQL